jgi:predicted RecB family nuclease
MERIHSSYNDNTIASALPVKPSTLRAGVPFVFDAKLTDQQNSIHFDGLKRVDGPSALGDFHYAPAVFSGPLQIHKSQRLMLAVLALLLSTVQGKVPRTGVIYHGRDCKGATVRLATHLKGAEALRDEVARMPVSEDPPKLALNGHCPICEFRQQCHAQAVQEANLTLIRGIGEKEIKRYGRKGLFTLTQLAHTFRPRRNRKQPDRLSNQRYHALHAMAIRDRRVYVLGKPEVPSGPVQIYLDMEGNPDEGFIYLIGVIVCDGDSEHRFSFWTDDKDQEHDIFQQLFALVARYKDPLVFSYGSYERAAIKRIRKHARRKKSVDKVLDALVNVLSLIYTHFYVPTYSSGLKDVGRYLGFAWSDELASGMESVAWRMRWDNTREDH